MGTWEGAWWVPGIATLPATHHPHYPGYTPPPPHARGVHCRGCTGMYGGLNTVVGLKSVVQLSLYVLFSGSRGITEVYNLIYIGRINNHFVIPGTEQAGVSNPWTAPFSAQQWSIKPQITPILDHRVSEGRDMGSGGHLGTSLGSGLGGRFWSILRSF